MTDLDTIRPLRWHDGALLLLDQRLLPHREEWVACRTPEEVAGAIRSMIVRGAPAIGVAAAFGMVLALGETGRLTGAAELLLASRPTAVNLRWAVDRMLAADAAIGHENAAGRRALLEHEALAILDEDLACNRAIGRLGSALLPQRAVVLTHCNAGALATAGYGTALGVIRSAVENGKRVAVYADETRPFLQGARLTAWELDRDGIDVTLITDGMAGHFFQQKTFDAVIVGADRIAANGDTANKIGTYQLAVLAQTHGVPFYVAAPCSTIDLSCRNGAGIPIEERSAEEIGTVSGIDDHGEVRSVRVAPEGVPARHPAFDVTPHSLIAAIITERGVARAPYEESLRGLFA